MSNRFRSYLKINNKKKQREVIIECLNALSIAMDYMNCSVDHPDFIRVSAAFENAFDVVAVKVQNIKTGLN